MAALVLGYCGYLVLDQVVENWPGVFVTPLEPPRELRELGPRPDAGAYPQVSLGNPSAPFDLGVPAIPEAEPFELEIPDVYTARNKEPKPLTRDEEKLIGRINSIPNFLADHPDLRAEAKIVNQGGTLPKRRNHVQEARNQIRMLNKARTHLQRVYDSRTPEAQQQIEAALKQANEYLQQLNDILSTK